MPHSERRALVPGSNGPAKWIQLGIVGAAGGGGGRRGARHSWQPPQAPPLSNLKGMYAFRRGSWSCLSNTVTPIVKKAQWVTGSSFVCPAPPSSRDRTFLSVGNQYH